LAAVKAIAEQRQGMRDCIVILNQMLSKRIILKSRNQMELLPILTRYHVNILEHARKKNVAHARMSHFNQNPRNREIRGGQETLHYTSERGLPLDIQERIDQRRRLESEQSSQSSYSSSASSEEDDDDYAGIPESIPVHDDSENEFEDEFGAILAPVVMPEQDPPAGFDQLHVNLNKCLDSLCEQLNTAGVGFDKNPNFRKEYVDLHKKSFDLSKLDGAKKMGSWFKEISARRHNLDRMADADVRGTESRSCWRLGLSI